MFRWQIIIFRALQEAQDIFGVDFDYEDFEKYGEDEYEEDEEDEDEYVDEEGVEDTERRYVSCTVNSYYM